MEDVFMELFFLDKLVLGLIKAMTWEKVFCNSIGLLCAVNFWCSKHKKGKVKK
jgi:hypothetical protein